MSKLYDIYTNLKDNENNKEKTLYAFKSGIFFILLEHDALIASKILNLKITYLNEKIIKCGFPIKSLDKYSKILKNFEYQLIIVDPYKSVKYDLKNYKINQEINNLLYNISTINIDTLSVSEAYSFIEKIKIEAHSILGGNIN